MSETTYSANYDGYQTWRSDENSHYESIYNNTELAENQPMLYIGELIYCLMQIYGGAPGWLGLGMDHASDDLNTLSQLQGLFSAPANYSTAQTQSILDQTDAMYQQADSISNPSSPDYDPSNPFFEVDQTLCTQLQTIMPPGWTFPTNVTPEEADSVSSYFSSEWAFASNGNTSYITATNTAFSNATSAVNGINSQLQSEEKYYNSQLQEFEGLFQNVTKSYSGVEGQSVNNEVPS